MPYAIELNFDPATEAVLRKIWSDLKEVGVGNEIVASDAPHVTLAVAETVEHEDLGARLAEFAGGHRPMGVALEFFGAFRSGVLFVAPVVTAELLGVHYDLHRRFPLHENAMSALYKPDAWQPHCTLTQGLSGAELARALEVAYRTMLPISGRLERLSLVEWRPAKTISSWELGGA